MMTRLLFFLSVFSLLSHIQATHGVQKRISRHKGPSHGIEEHILGVVASPHGNVVRGKGILKKIKPKKRAKRFGPPDFQSKSTTWVYESIGNAISDLPKTKVDGKRLLELESKWEDSDILIPLKAELLDSSLVEFEPHHGENTRFENWLGINLNASLIEPTFRAVNRHFGPLMSRSEAVRLIFHLSRLIRSILP